MTTSLPLILALGMVATGQNPGAAAAGAAAIDQKRVDQAIKSGVAFLEIQGSPGAHRGIRNSDELILLTLVHAGVPDEHPRFQELLQKILKAKLERTYSVALRAMCLEAIDRVKYQAHIYMCAQFFVDNHCKNGQWPYGRPSPYAKPPAPTPTPRRSVASGGGGGVVDLTRRTPEPTTRRKPKVGRRLAVRKRRDGPSVGDNSNAQYAALGLRACHDAGIVIPPETIHRAMKWWYTSHLGNVKIQGDEKKDVATGAGETFTAVPRGWCYKGYNNCKNPDKPYSAMTVGAIGALTIYNYMLKRDWRKDKVVRAGMSWMSKNWSVTEVLGPSEVHRGVSNAYYYYYLYALERLGMLYDTKTIGPHDWYREGANVILNAQFGDGSWEQSDPKNPVWDTCFAILFLKRATKRLIPVASIDDNSR